MSTPQQRANDVKYRQEADFLAQYGDKEGIENFLKREAIAKEKKEVTVFIDNLTARARIALNMKFGKNLMKLLLNLQKRIHLKIRVVYYFLLLYFFYNNTFIFNTLNLKLCQNL